MARIIQLDKGLINKIAAGEVVERPLSVVKELLENAIDAGASMVTVEIADGGTSLVRVTDNGSGIAESDLSLVFARHATSKISSFDELMQVQTLGFRGEALSSISSVAQVELVTRTADADAAFRVVIHGGEVLQQGKAGAAKGTSISVENLFFNTPARRKFLKKPATEAGYISHLLERLALANPNLALKYIHNGQLIFQTYGGGDLRANLLAIYGREVAVGCIAVDAVYGDLELTGLIGKPQHARGNRQHASFFVNGRYVDCWILKRAVENAMRTLIPHGKFPLYALNMTIPPREVDVNVHPTKMDVRFADERAVSDFVENAVREVREDTALMPGVRARHDFPRVADIDSQLEQMPVYTVVQRIEPQEEADHRTSNEDAVFLREEATPVSAPTPEIHRVFEDYTILGLVFSTFWLVAAGESLLMIDLHAAHERVLYEEILAGAGRDVSAQRLLSPQVLHLTPREQENLRENMDLFTRFGFEIENSGDMTAVLSVPLLLRGPVDTAFFTEILDKLSDGANMQDVYGYNDGIVAMAACKAAVKAGDTMSEGEAHALIAALLALPNPFTCPHGRPTMVEMTRREMERRFGR